MQNNKVEYFAGIDILRICACLLVILLHVTAQGFYPFSHNWQTFVGYSSISRMAVPLFFMISGYLLLCKEECISSFLKKRFLRIFLPFVITLFIYYFYKGLNLKNFVYAALNSTSGVDFHFWFIYALIGIYLFIPVLQPLFVDKDRRKTVIYYLIIWYFLCVSFPFFKTFLSLGFNFPSNFNLIYFSGYLGYFFLGALLRKTEINKKFQIFCGVMVILITYLIFKFTVAYSLQKGVPSELFFGALSPLVSVQALTFFVFINQCHFQSHFLTYVAKHTYWIFLIHILVLRMLKNYYDLNTNDNIFLAIPSITIAVFIISFIVSIPLMQLENHILKLFR